MSTAISTFRRIRADKQSMSNFQSNKAPPSARKLRGGYYTPAPLADYLCRWAIRKPSDRVIEPACGDGVFVRSATSQLGKGGTVTAVEVVPTELERAKRSVDDCRIPVRWHCGSYFELAPPLLRGERFDAAIGNPPFIRFQYFDKQERDQAFGLLRQFGYRPSGLANAWVAFVELAAEMLRDGGRLAMIVPAELLQVQYAAELRARLPLLFEDVSLVAFEELVFPHIQQEVVLLLADGRRRQASKPGEMHIQQAPNGEALVAKARCRRRTVSISAHVAAGQKWTALFLSEPEAELLRTFADRPDLHRLGDLADVDVGVVTGRNRFFVVSEEQARYLQLGDHALDVVGRTSALRSTRFTEADMRRYATANRSKLLNLSGLPRTAFSRALSAYVAQGEAEGVSQGYKCRIRNRWFDVPSVGVPDAFLYRQIHMAPLLAANHAAATSTDTIHRVRVHARVDREQLCGAMVNSVTFACAEVGGRSYGGGVLELEPREAENLPVPYQFAGELDLDYLDARLRAGDLPGALAHGDDVLLRRGCGMSQREVERASRGWSRLRSRRQRRRSGARRKRSAALQSA